MRFVDGKRVDGFLGGKGFDRPMSGGKGSSIGGPGSSPPLSQVRQCHQNVMQHCCNLQKNMKFMAIYKQNICLCIFVEQSQSPPMPAMAKQAPMPKAGGSKHSKNKNTKK